ncbi:MAG TPA: hypothetical protein VFD98_10380 [Terracidiphilus sp.]|jgi:hypothetical protein|nr:hypothetical protein [Terracidiphilus sp.]
MKKLMVLAGRTSQPTDILVTADIFDTIRDLFQRQCVPDHGAWSIA